MHIKRINNPSLGIRHFAVVMRCLCSSQGSKKWGEIIKATKKCPSIFSPFPFLTYFSLSEYSVCLKKTSTFFRPRKPGTGETSPKQDLKPEGRLRNVRVGKGSHWHAMYRHSWDFLPKLHRAI